MVLLFGYYSEKIPHFYDIGDYIGKKMEEYKPVRKDADCNIRR